MGVRDSSLVLRIRAVPSPAAVETSSPSPSISPAPAEAGVIIVEYLPRTHGVADHAIRRGAIGALDAFGSQVCLYGRAQAIRIQRVGVGGRLVGVRHVFLRERIGVAVGQRQGGIRVGGNGQGGTGREAENQSADSGCMNEMAT
jgi:hypothetical protein